MNVLDHYKNGKSALYKTTFYEGSSPSLPIGASMMQTEEDQNTDETLKLRATTDNY